MKRSLGFFLLLAVILIVSGGCALTPEQRAEYEKTLKAQVDGFVDDAVQGHWDKAFALSVGQYQTPDQLRTNLAKSLPDNASLVGGEVASMAWEDDKTAKVKLNWVFRQGSALGYSSETFVWVLKGATWKYQGRALR
jgi:hypothetical protein